MHKTAEMLRYDKITEGFSDLSDDLKRNVLLSAIEYLSSLSPSCHMYGDNFGWVTAAELLRSCESRLEFVEHNLIDAYQNAEMERYHRDLEDDVRRHTQMEEWHEEMRRDVFGE